MSSDEIVALARLVARQAYILNLTSLQLADQACLLEPRLERCEKCKAEPVTVTHRHLNVRVCDRCAAESIVKSARAYVDGYLANPDDPLNDVRQSLMDENDWLDVHDADKIRRVCDYAKIVKELDVNPDRIH